jgi:hypothetical protein
MHGTFGWNELMTADVEASKAFYAKVAGWTYQDVPFNGGTYTLASAPGNPVSVAGIMHWPADQPGANDWFAYINVDDIEKSVAAAVEAGGTVMRPPFKIENTGWIAIIKDSASCMIGLLQPLPM